MSDRTKGSGTLPPTRRIILDTDIGTDVDDLMALSLILGTPELDLVAVTTVYGDTRLRAQVASRVLHVVGRIVPIHAGVPAPLSGKDVWWAGHEGALFENLENDAYDSDDAVRFLVDSICNAPGEIDVVAIGPLTNIARAIESDARFAPSVRHLWVMGGSFTGNEPEHNFRSDSVAARAVFSAGIPATVTGLDVTRKISIGESELARIAASGAVGRIIESEVHQWWKYWDATWNVPHDPVTVLTITRPDLFDFSQPGNITIGTGNDEGVSSFVSGSGVSRVVVDLAADEVSASIVDGIIASNGPAHGQRIG